MPLPRGRLAASGPLPQSSASPRSLVSILDWLRAPAEPEAIEALRAMAPLLHFQLPGRASRWDAIGLSVCLRNRISHDPGFDAGWWSAMAGRVESIASTFAAIPPCLVHETLIYPSPWFLERDGAWMSYSGIRGDDAIYHAPGRGPLKVPLSETELLDAFQHVLGQAELRQASFRELMKRLAPDEHRGVLVGDFLLGPPAAEGGFAVVHRGYQLSIERKVALKIFPDGLTASKRALLRKEAERLGSFNTPEIVRLIGFYEEIPGSAPRDVSLAGEAWFADFKKASPFKTFLAMEWVEGEDLKAVFARPPEGRPGDDTLIAWFHSAAEALAKVHAAGLTHMDVTPSNIRVTPEGQVKLMDFGIARSEAERQDLITRTRLGVGTPEYMAPEQFDDRANRQSDVYSLCATFYELFTGRRLREPDPDGSGRPWREGTAIVPPRAIRREIPWEVETLLLGGLGFEPADRPTSRQLADDLGRLRQDRPIEYRRPPLRRRAALWYRRHRPAVRVAAPALGALAALAIVLGVFWRGAEKKSAEFGEQVGTLSKKVQAESGRAETEAERATREQRLKLLQQYIADMRLLPELWKNARVDLIRDRLRAYAAPGPDDLRGFEWYYWDRLANSASPTWKAGDPIRSLDWSADGRTLFASDAKGRLRAWDRVTGEAREVRDVRGEDAASIVVASASKGRRLASVARRLVPGSRESSSVALIDPETGRETGRIVAKGLPYRAAALSPDGRRLVTSDLSTDLVVWDAETGKFLIDLYRNDKTRRDNSSPMTLLDVHDPTRGPVHALAFSPDGTLVASGGDDGGIGIWNSRTGQNLGWLGDRSGGRVASVSFSGDGQKLLSHTLPRPREQFNRVALAGEIAIWRLSARDPIRRIELPDESPGRVDDGLAGRSGNFRADFLMDDRLVASGVGNVVRVWDLGTGQLVKEFKGHTSAVKALRAAPGGTILASADEDGEVRIWDLDEPEAIETVARFPGPARSIALAELGGGEPVALHESAGSSVSDGTNEPSEKWELARINPGGTNPEREPGFYLGLAQSPGGKRLASFDWLKHEILVWEAGSGEPTRKFPVTKAGQKGEVRCLAFRSEDDLYAVTDEGLRRYRIVDGSSAPIAGLAAGPQPRRTREAYLVEAESVMALGFSADGRLAAVGTGGRVVTVYDAETWKPRARLSGHTRGITGVAFSPDGRRLASSGGRYARPVLAETDVRPGEVIVWDTTTWQDSLTLTHPSPSEFEGVGFGDGGWSLYATANPVAVSPGKLARGEVVRWVGKAVGPKSPAKLASRPPTLRPPSAPARPTRPLKSRPLEGARFTAPGLFMAIGGVVGLNSVAVHPTGELIAAVTVVNRLVLWDARSGEVVRESTLQEIGIPGYRVDFTPDGSHLICSEITGEHPVVRSVPDLQEVTSEPEKVDLGPKFPVKVDLVKVGEDSFPAGPGPLARGRPPVSRDGRLIALTTPGSEPTLLVVSIEKKAELFSAPLVDPPLLVGFSADSRVAYAVTRPAGAASATFRRWKVPSGEPLGTVDGLGNLAGIAPDLGRCLEVPGGGEIYARDLSTGRRAEAPFAVESGLRGIAFFPDGEHVATFGGQNWASVWNVNRPLKIPENFLVRVGLIGNLTVSPDGRRIAFLDPAGSIAVHEIGRGPTSRLAVGASRGVHPVPTGFTPDGRALLLASGTDHGYNSLKAIELETGAEIKLAPRPSEVRPPGFGPGDPFPARLLAAHASSGSEVWYLLHRSAIPPGRREKAPPEYVLWNGREATVPAAFAETLTIPPRPTPNARARSLRDTVDNLIPVTTAAFSPSGDHLAYLIPARPVISDKKTPEVVVLATEDGRIVSRFPCGNEQIQSLHFTHDDGMVLLTGRLGDPTDMRVEVVVGFDLKTGRETFRAAGSRPGPLAVSREGRRLASSAADGSIVIETLPERAEVARISPDDGPMSPVAFLPGGAKLLTSGAHGAIRLWDLPR